MQAYGVSVCNFWIGFLPEAFSLDFADDGVWKFRIFGVEIDLLAVIKSDVEVRGIVSIDQQDTGP